MANIPQNTEYQKTATRIKPAVGVDLKKVLESRKKLISSLSGSSGTSTTSPTKNFDFSYLLNNAPTIQPTTEIAPGPLAIDTSYKNKPLSEYQAENPNAPLQEYITPRDAGIGFTPTTKIANLNSSVTPNVRGQYLFDPEQPGALIKNQYTFDPREKAMILNGLPMSSFEVDHVIPRWAGGADTLDNKEILTKAEHKKKTSIQAIPYTAYYYSHIANTPENQLLPDQKADLAKLTPTQLSYFKDPKNQISVFKARVLAQGWKDKSTAFVPQANDYGMVSPQDAIDVLTMWDEVPKTGIMDVLKEIPGAAKQIGKNIAGTFSQAVSNIPLLSGFAKGVAKGQVSQATLGYMDPEIIGEIDQNVDTWKNLSIAGKSLVLSTVEREKNKNSSFNINAYLASLTPDKLERIEDEASFFGSYRNFGNSVTEPIGEVIGSVVGAGAVFRKLEATLFGGAKNIVGSLATRTAVAAKTAEEFPMLARIANSIAKAPSTAKEASVAIKNTAQIANEINIAAKGIGPIVLEKLPTIVGAVSKEGKILMDPTTLPKLQRLYTLSSTLKAIGLQNVFGQLQHQEDRTIESTVERLAVDTAFGWALGRDLHDVTGYGKVFAKALGISLMDGTYQALGDDNADQQNILKDAFLNAAIITGLHGVAHNKIRPIEKEYAVQASLNKLENHANTVAEQMLKPYGVFEENKISIEDFRSMSETEKSNLIESTKKKAVEYAQNSIATDENGIEYRAVWDEDNLAYELLKIDTAFRQLEKGGLGVSARKKADLADIKTYTEKMASLFPGGVEAAPATNIESLLKSKIATLKSPSNQAAPSEEQWNLLGLDAPIGHAAVTGITPEISQKRFSNIKRVEQALSGKGDEITLDRVVFVQRSEMEPFMRQVESKYSEADLADNIRSKSTNPANYVEMLVPVQNKQTGEVTFLKIGNISTDHRNNSRMTRLEDGSLKNVAINNPENLSQFGGDYVEMTVDNDRIASWMRKNNTKIIYGKLEKNYSRGPKTDKPFVSASISADDLTRSLQDFAGSDSISPRLGFYSDIQQARKAKTPEDAKIAADTVIQNREVEPSSELLKAIQNTEPDVPSSPAGVKTVETFDRMASVLKGQATPESLQRTFSEIVSEHLSNIPGVSKEALGRIKILDLLPQETVMKWMQDPAKVTMKDVFNAFLTSDSVFVKHASDQFIRPYMLELAGFSDGLLNTTLALPVVGSKIASKPEKQNIFNVADEVNETLRPIYGEDVIGVGMPENLKANKKTASFQKGMKQLPTIQAEPKMTPEAPANIKETIKVMKPVIEKQASEQLVPKEPVPKEPVNIEYTEAGKQRLKEVGIATKESPDVLDTEIALTASSRNTEVPETGATESQISERLNRQVPEDMIAEVTPKEIESKNFTEFNQGFNVGAIKLLSNAQSKFDVGSPEWKKIELAKSKVSKKDLMDGVKKTIEQNLDANGKPDIGKSFIEFSKNYGEWLNSQGAKNPFANKNSDESRALFHWFHRNSDPIQRQKLVLQRNGKELSESVVTSTETEPTSHLDNLVKETNQTEGTQMDLLYLDPSDAKFALNRDPQAIFSRFKKKGYVVLGASGNNLNDLFGIKLDKKLIDRFDTKSEMYLNKGESLKADEDKFIRVFMVDVLGLPKDASYGAVLKRWKELNSHEVTNAHRSNDGTIPTYKQTIIESPLGDNGKARYDGVIYVTEETAKTILQANGMDSNIKWIKPTFVSKINGKMILQKGEIKVAGGEDIVAIRDLIGRDLEPNEFLSFNDNVKIGKQTGAWNYEMPATDMRLEYHNPHKVEGGFSFSNLSKYSSSDNSVEGLKNNYHKQIQRWNEFNKELLAAKDADAIRAVYDKYDDYGISESGQWEKIQNMMGNSAGVDDLRKEIQDQSSKVLTDYVLAGRWIKGDHLRITPSTKTRWKDPMTGKLTEERFLNTDEIAMSSKAWKKAGSPEFVLAYRSPTTRKTAMIKAKVVLVDNANLGDELVMLSHDDVFNRLEGDYDGDAIRFAVLGDDNIPMAMADSIQKDREEFGDIMLPELTAYDKKYVTANTLFNGALSGIRGGDEIGIIASTMRVMNDLVASGIKIKVSKPINGKSKMTVYSKKDRVIYEISIKNDGTGEIKSLTPKWESGTQEDNAQYLAALMSQEATDSQKYQNLSKRLYAAEQLGLSNTGEILIGKVFDIDDANVIKGINKFIQRLQTPYKLEGEKFSTNEEMFNELSSYLELTSKLRESGGDIGWNGKIVEAIKDTQPISQLNSAIIFKQDSAGVTAVKKLAFEENVKTKYSTIIASNKVIENFTRLVDEKRFEIEFNAWKQNFARKNGEAITVESSSKLRNDIIDSYNAIKPSLTTEEDAALKYWLITDDRANLRNTIINNAEKNRYEKEMAEFADSLDASLDGEVIPDYRRNRSQFQKGQVWRLDDIFAAEVNPMAQAYYEGKRTFNPEESLQLKSNLEFEANKTIEALRRRYNGAKNQKNFPIKRINELKEKLKGTVEEKNIAIASLKDIAKKLNRK